MPDYLNDYQSTRSDTRIKVNSDKMYVACLMQKIKLICDFHMRSKFKFSYFIK